MLYEKWIIPETDADLQAELSYQLKISPVTAQLLVNRKISDPSAAKIFLNPSIEHIIDPSCLADIQTAVHRINHAIKNSENILVFGDYDVDGITGTAILVSFFRLTGKTVRTYIPHRLTEGYGLSVKAIEKFKNDNINLIITVDCGVTNVKEIALAKKLGMDVIVTDHHEPAEELPDAIAIINPKLRDSKYPFRNVSGATVAFKLAWALAQDFSASKKISSVFQDFILEAMCFAALGTIADVVPLIDENRTIATVGLQLLDKTANKGLKSLIAKNRRNGNGKLTPRDVAFVIAPRINAMGRMRTADICLELLLSNHQEKIDEILGLMEKSNRERQKKEAEIIVEAELKLKTEEDIENENIIILAGQGWHQGVIGIVAAKLSEKYFMPVIIISTDKDNEFAKGTVRSCIKAWHATKSLDTVKECLANYGGHESAAGFVIARDDIPELKKKLHEYANMSLTDDDFSTRLCIDAELLLPSINYQLAREVDKLSPYGSGNPVPVFASSGVNIVKGPDIQGQKNDTIAFKISQNNTTLPVVGFFKAHMYDYINAHKDQPCSIAYELNLNSYFGSENIQLILKDIKFE